MGKKRKVFSGAFKARVALETIRKVKTAAQIVSEFQVHPAQVARWKKQAVEGGGPSFLYSKRPHISN